MVYKLTHDSISYINIINGSYLCAVIKHPIFVNISLFRRMIIAYLLNAKFKIYLMIIQIKRHISR
jgi:hypothetical protein